MRSGAEQVAFVPPLTPVQDQFHVLLEFVTDVGFPAEQRLATGLVAVLTPFAVPHTPLMERLAAQLAVIPPLVPAHVQFHGPVPLTAEAEPAEQSPDDGAE